MCAGYSYVSSCEYYMLLYARYPALETQKTAELEEFIHILAFFVEHKALIHI